MALLIGQVVVEFFTVRRVSGGPNQHTLAPHRAIPIPLIPRVPPGVVCVRLVLALLGAYGSHTGAGPLTDIAAACATDIISIGRRHTCARKTAMVEIVVVVDAPGETSTACDAPDAAHVSVAVRAAAAC